MERVAVRNGNGNGNGIRQYGEFCNGYSTRGDGVRNWRKQKSASAEDASGSATTSSSSSNCTSPSSSVVSASGGGGAGFIEHQVSRFDTLAGVAIKYGVEVADIKKMNSLVTDLQMFALKTIQIPLPGRHPPSPCLSNGSLSPGQNSAEHTPLRRLNADFLDSFQSLKLGTSQRKVSPAMNSLQGYYGLKSPMDSVDFSHRENGEYLTPMPASNQPLSQHRKSKSMVQCILEEVTGGFPGQLMGDSGGLDSERWNAKLVKRRQKSEADFTRPDLLMREDNSSRSLSLCKGKGLALRSTAANRNTSSTEGEIGSSSPVPTLPGDSLVADGFSLVRKSSSASNLQEQESSSNSSSLWPTSKWNLKPDLQALTAAAIGKPIFDGLPKPTTGRKNKTALD